MKSSLGQGGQEGAEAVLAKAAGRTQNGARVVRRAFDMNMLAGIMAGGIGHKGVAGIEVVIGFPDDVIALDFIEGELPADGDGLVRLVVHQLGEENGIAAATFAQAGEEIPGQGFIIAPGRLPGPLAQLFG